MTQAAKQKDKGLSSTGADQKLHFKKYKGRSNNSSASLSTP
jgi:hypothetical protein